MGKTKDVRLLKVFFHNENGQPDSAAWQVKDLEAWLALLKT